MISVHRSGGVHWELKHTFSKGGQGRYLTPGTHHDHAGFHNSYIYLSTCLSVSVPIYLYICLSVCLSIFHYLPTYCRLPTYLPIHLAIYQFVCLSVYLSS